MKNSFLILSLIALFLSCSRKKQFPDYKTQKISNEQLTVKMPDAILTKPLINDSLKNNDLPDCLDQLSILERYFNNKNQNFNFKKLKENWDNCSNELYDLNLNEIGLKKWIDATGLLLQLTAEAKYAEKLESIFFATSSAKIKEEVGEYAITKNVDHLHVNLFIPAKIEYDHSLGGHVKMLIETNYPESGKVQLKFSTEKNRYIELFIRIPSWEHDAHVIVKGVKYLAPAGTYCKIAKKWKDGDVAEIVFPHARNHNMN